MSLYLDRLEGMLTIRVASNQNVLDWAKELPFAVDSSVKEGKLVMKVQGRVDTLTSTQLLKAFQEASEVDSIELDVEKMPYISSAGLRVLLSAQKIMNKQGKMAVRNANETVLEIFEVTGFSEILTIE